MAIKPQYAIVGKPVKTGIPTKIGGTVQLPRPPAPEDPYAGLLKIALSGVQTPAQIAATANAQAVAQERAQLAAQKAVSDQTTAQYNNQATRAQGFAAALAKLQSGEDDQAFARYGDAADRLVGIGTGLTGAVGAGYQDAVDRTKAAVAQLTGGLGQTTAPDASAITNAAQYAGVTMPAMTLEESAANAARMAGSDASARAQDIAHIGQNYSAQADQAIAQAGSDARALIAKRPATIADLVNQLTSNRQTGIANLGNVLQARTSYQTGQQNRADTLAQRAVTNLLAGRAADRADRQLDITQQGIEQQQRIQIAQITGRDPLTNQPTFTREQWNAQTDAQKKSYAATQATQLGYQVDWQTGLAKVVDGHIVPNAGFKVDPQNPGRAVIDLSQKAPTASSLHPHGSISASLSDRYHVQVYDDGTPKIVNGKTVFYPSKAAKPAKPMSVKDKQAWMLQINTAADNLAKGWTDPGTNGATHAKVSATEALQQMIKWGYFVSKPLAEMAQEALRQAYPDYESQVALGFKTGPLKSEATITKPPGVPEPPARWDSDADPLVRSGPKPGTGYAKSGRLVAIGAMRYLDSY